MTRYELLERIGVGGMAEVFRGRATAVGGFEKPVAIKKILPHLSQDNRFVSMLIAEAKLLANLRQRNIVQIYDVGLGEDGGYFLVMEYVDGHDVGALFERMEKKRERFPLDLALHIGSEVCEALEHAHKAADSQGKALSLVHRDVSPSNVMLSNSGEVKLTDFGIAKKGDKQSAVQTIAGKFAYMSPEQASAKPVGPESDQYSLAVIMWEILLGRRLYDGMPELEILRLVREARVTRPREVDPTFSRELESILMKALSPDPRQRYATASLFGAALRDYRYSAATAGDPVREIQALLRRYFGADGKGKPAPREESKIVRIQTVAGFDPVPGEVQPGKSRRAVDTFDAPTVASDGLMALPGVAPVPAPAAPLVPSGASANGSGRAPLTLPSFDHDTDDMETRMLEARGRRPEPSPSARAATPTLQDMPVGMLVDRGRAVPATSLPVPVPVDRDLFASLGRRKTVALGALAIALLLVVGIMIARLAVGGSQVRPAAGPEAQPASGAALEGPAIKAPVKKSGKRKPPAPAP